MAILSFVGSPGSLAAASGGKIRAFNNISNGGSVTVAPANPARQSLTFHNPGTVDIFVFPVVDATGAALAPNNAALGGAFRIFANGGTLVVSGECQTAWGAFSASGAGNPFTTMETNI